MIGLRPLAALETPRAVIVSCYVLACVHVDRSFSSVVTFSYKEINFISEGSIFIASFHLAHPF